MAAYTVILERDESGAWISRVPSVPGCHTYGRSITQAISRTRQALSLWVDDADAAELRPKFRLPDGLLRAADRGRIARLKASRAQIEAQDALASAARSLTRGGLSRRDAAELLGVSHQRVQQLLSATPG